MSVFGYASEEAFRKAVSAEMDQRTLHEHRDGLRPGQEKPKRGQRTRTAKPPDTKPLIAGPQRAEALGITGAPGSPERLRQVRQIAPELFDEAQREQRAAQVSLLLDRWAQSETSDYDAAVVHELARAVWDVQDEQFFHAVRGAIENISGDTEDFDSMIAHRIQVETQQQQAQHDQAETQRTADIHAGLERSYDRIERDLGPAGLLAAHEVAETWGEELYDPEVDADAVRVGLRAAAELGRGQEYVGNTFRTHQALSEEFKRVGAPGSRWNDEERAKWEQEMEEGNLETAMRADARYNDLEAVTARALQAHAVEKSGTTPFEAALKEEFAQMREHDSTAPHREAMREHQVAEYERTHDEAGRDISDPIAERYR